MELESITPQANPTHNKVSALEHLNTACTFFKEISNNNNNRWFTLCHVTHWLKSTWGGANEQSCSRPACELLSSRVSYLSSLCTPTWSETRNSDQPAVGLSCLNGTHWKDIRQPCSIYCKQTVWILTSSTRFLLNIEPVYMHTRIQIRIRYLEATSGPFAILVRPTRVNEKVFTPCM